jgi:hypothetical protein
VRKSLALTRDLKIPVLGLIENMAGYACQHCQAVGELFRAGEGIRLARDFGIPFLGEIPFDSRMARAGDSGLPFVAIHQEAAAGRVFRAMAHELLAVVNGQREECIERGTR